MKKKEYSIKAVIIGSGKLFNEVINRILVEDAIVIAATPKYKEIDILRKKIVNNSKIITFLTDISDYKKADEFLSEIVDEYGMIDLAVGIFDNHSLISGSLLVDMNCNDFEQLINQNIINYFLVCRILLHAMKQSKYGTCITVSNLNELVEKKKNYHISVLISIIGKIQKKMSEIFSNEVKDMDSSSINYYHLSANQFSNKVGSIEAGGISNYILDLYKKQNQN